MSFHDSTLSTAAPQIREDGWSPARQRRFLEVLASSGVIMLACEAVRITARSAYNLRNRRDGAAFRLGWDAAILIARARLATDLLARAITGNEEVIRKDPDNHEITRHRHDNRLAMSMLARLDRMADSPVEGSDAALARIVAQDFAAYLDMLCPEDMAQAELDGLALPRTGAEPGARNMADAHLLDGSRPDTPDPIEEAVAAALSPGASAALFIAARLPLAAGQNPQISVADERCELRPEPAPDDEEEEEEEELIHWANLTPDETVDRLRSIWWNDVLLCWQTDFPPPPGFTGYANAPTYEIDGYVRGLSPKEEQALEAMIAEDRRPYEEAAAQARDLFFGFLRKEDILPEAADVTTKPAADMADTHSAPA
ncbi:hypothetical protein SAMN05518849_12738 [Sphingobium sp. AP50]|uniref:hypothetical protein n=1 Tax=Sphingobium sp. AP50 TaxID=1884369 RepID=UPI0008D703BE|nr:hypothetical protein [Sphingobium sp. AP50]SEK01795.1 hypothetical protein SAMN05518849_12738 [Sphingobium sp. AP50]